MSQNPQALKPCPFCGREPELYTVSNGDGAELEFVFRCEECGVEKSAEWKHEAVAVWNRRASQEAAAPSEEPVAWPEPKVLNPDIGQETGIPYLDCLLDRLMDAQQDVNLAANEHMDQSLADASSVMGEVETAIRKLSTSTGRTVAWRWLDGDHCWQATCDEDRASYAFRVDGYEVHDLFASPAVAPVASVKAKPLDMFKPETQNWRRT